MKTNEEIKRGLRCCAEHNLCERECPYDRDPRIAMLCTSELARDALELIERMEGEDD